MILCKLSLEKIDCFSKFFDHAKRTDSSYLEGHCFVSLAMCIPIVIKGHIKYITIPVAYKLYDKLQTKLELDAEMIEIIMPKMPDYHVIVLGMPRNLL